jgi:hypothetical protein
MTIVILNYLQNDSATKVRFICSDDSGEYQDLQNNLQSSQIGRKFDLTEPGSSQQNSKEEENCNLAYFTASNYESS